MLKELEQKRSPAGVLMRVDDSRLSAKSREVIVAYNKDGHYDAGLYLRAVDEARMIGCDNLSFGNSPLESSHRVVLGKTALGRIFD